MSEAYARLYAHEAVYLLDSAVWRSYLAHVLETIECFSEGPFPFQSMIADRDDNSTEGQVDLIFRLDKHRQ